MRFPRHARIFRGQLDAAPFAGVFFLVLIFITFNSQLVFTPGVRIELPQAGGLPGTANPTLAVLVDPSGQFYLDNQAIAEAELKQRLVAAADKARSRGAQLTLVVLADTRTPNKVLFHLGELAREAGIKELLQAARPRATPAPPNASPP
ncbi:MAG: biopolymer transporter ExbD [Verrucomicrobia bacterium]|nr:biopolymer transporter ExbD [Verrucomicrobiota bacterium]